MILRAIGRLIMVPLGFAVGLAVAILVLISLGLERMTQALTGRAWESGSLELLIDMALGFVSLAGAATVIPALLLVVVGEVARIRSALYYVFGGGVAVALLPLLARATVGDGAGSIGPLGQIWPVFATAGFAGGLAYWLLAGRRA